MAHAYDPKLRQTAQQVAEDAEIPTHSGVYICLAGPTYETPADTRFLRLIGADAVGMSTVPEVTVARHMGLSVLGISGITNVIAAPGDDAAETSHEEVLAAGKLIVPRLITVVRGVLDHLT
jgi:purine-nucleoside phosphorylase